MYKQIILNSNQFVLQKIRCYHFAQLNLEEFTLGKTSGGGGGLGHLHPSPVHYLPMLDQTYLGTKTICNYKCYLLNLTSLSIIQLFTQGCTDKGPPLKSQGLYFYINYSAVKITLSI